MHSLLRNMAKAEMVRRGYPKVNRQMHRLYGDWRSLIGAYPDQPYHGQTNGKGFPWSEEVSEGPPWSSLRLLKRFDILR